MLQDYGLEWDRVLLTTLGVANKRLYELRLQTAEVGWARLHGCTAARLAACPAPRCTCPNNALRTLGRRNPVHTLHARRAQSSYEANKPVLDAIRDSFIVKEVEG